MSDIQAIRSTLASIDVSSCDEAALRTITDHARGVERAVASLIVRIARRSSELAAAGMGGSPAEGLLGGGNVSGRTSRHEAKRAAVAEDLPSMAHALDDGSISGEHLDAVATATSHLSADEKAELFADDEQLAAAAASLPVDTFRKRMRREAERVRRDHGRSTAAQQREASEFRSWTGKDGMGHFRGSLDPERFTGLITAIEREMTALANSNAIANRNAIANSNRATKANGLADGQRTKNANLAAAALCELVGHGNGARGRAHISLIVDEQTALHGPHEHSIRQTTDGTSLPPETIDRFCCDAVIRRIVMDSRGVPIDVGRAHRTATDAQWAMLKALHSTCAWQGCDRPVDWCQAHHILEWEQGGPTDLDNLVPLCSQHHHRVHEGQWTIKLSADRTLRIHRPDGTLWGESTPDRLRQWLDDRHSHQRPHQDRQQARGRGQP